jgi:hypothetical protein
MSGTALTTEQWSSVTNWVSRESIRTFQIEVDI